MADLTQLVGEISYSRGRLVIDECEVPLDDVGIILVGAGAKLSGEVLMAAARFDVALVCCDWRGVPVVGCTPWSENSRVGARHRAQAELSRPRQKSAWQQVVRAKILGQAANLDRCAAQQAERLRRHATAVRSGDVTNREAQAARLYWRHVFSQEFRRSPDLDGRNAQLNYGYAVLRGWVVRAIVQTGLHPGLGMFHRNRANAFALADDLIEPFRPAVDHVAQGLTDDIGLDRDQRRALVAILRQPWLTTGATVATAITDLAIQYARYVEGYEERLVVSHWAAADG